MRNQGQLIFGGLIILLGLALLAGQLFQIDVWAFCWPAGLIFLGIWLILRPQLAEPGTGVTLRPFGNVKRYGAWQVNGEEIWMFVGDAHLDLTRAELPPGETRIRFFGFVGDINLLVPRDLQFSVSSTAFLTDARIYGQKHESFLSPVEYNSPGYPSAERRFRLEMLFFVADLDIDQIT